MITLQNIKQKHEEISNMIAALENYAQQKVHYPAIDIDLNQGEKSAGLVLGKDGDLDYFLILLPDAIDNTNWKDATAWAEKQGGDTVASLPTRREQAILFGNLKEEFEEAYYWSSEQHASYSDYAWYQLFYDGYQNSTLKSYEMRARAVRRILIIQ